ncbi:MAG: cbb3-type cytochrome oxidase assembly protein CcoS [Alcanivorax sp.]|nr:MAG: cbb3-type cytochrome oxidase assembly protein CcoS [Oceanobacter sp.]
MDIIYVLVPLSIVLILIAILIFSWAVKGGQFDDLDSPAHRILFDDDDHLIDRKESPTKTDTAKDPGSEKKND